MKESQARNLRDMSSSDIFNILKSSGKSRHYTDYPVLQSYLDMTGKHPCIKNYANIQLKTVDFMNDLQEYITETLYVKYNYDDKHLEHGVENTVAKLAKGYVIEMSACYESIDLFSVTIEEILKSLTKKNTVLVSNVMLLCPGEDSPLYNREFEDIFTNLIRKHKLSKNITTPCIGMICIDDGEYYLKDFFIKKDYVIADGDLHYGDGFTVFHDKLMSRFKNDTKGLVLLHGHPGTGKTYYIRSLMKDLTDIGKYVIYLPPNMVENMVDPNMMSFLSQTVMEKMDDNKSCILLLEDAEPLLTSRKSENRSGGITNLLNITDGLLNDMLSIQVIATFNTSLGKIDEALLRPERLIARKEFKLLKKEDAKKLAKLIGIDKAIDNDMSLAEIYAYSNDREILIHEYNESSRIGFNR